MCGQVPSVGDPSSPIADLFKEIAASPFALAPERAAELHEIRKERQIRIQFDDGVLRDKNFRVDPQRGSIRVGLHALERLWAGCHAHWQLAKATERYVKHGTPIEFTEDLSLQTALNTLTWAHAEDAEDEWPCGLPRPAMADQRRGPESEATEFFLVAAGWSLLHEIGHVVYRHPTVSTPADSRRQERQADEWATKWVLSRWRDHSEDVKVFGKRAVGVTLALCDIAFLEAYGRTAGGTTHPDPAQRLGNFLQDDLPQYAGDASGPFLEFARLAACAALKLHFDKQRIELDATIYATADDLLSSTLCALARIS